MDAFHSFWSRPNANKNRGKIKFPDYELLTVVLSALKWKEMNGSIKMITDSAGAEFFESKGLGCLWDEIDISLDHMNSEVDPFLFWAAGKLYALKSVSCPCVMLDTDLIIWKNVEELFQYDVVGAHFEALSAEVYPDIRTFKRKEGYSFPEEWNFRTEAINTAFLFIKDSVFKDYYIESAEKSMDGIISQGLNPVTAMCFAEQRVLAMCAEAKKLQVRCLCDFENMNRQDVVTHLWGYKQRLRASYNEKREYCMRCIRRIISDFPEYESIIANNRSFFKYYREIERERFFVV